MPLQSKIGNLESKISKALALRPRITPGVPLSVTSKELSINPASLIFIVCFVNNYDTYHL